MEKRTKKQLKKLISLIKESEKLELDKDDGVGVFGKRN